MNNKKILALLLAFAMMFSTITTAFADTTATIGADAEALKTIDVLRGDDGGVTSEYLAKETTRMQAAIMYLRLKGLEDEAMAFTGTDNFTDASTMTWGEGKAIMAYLKANPQLGWVGGDGGKFEPFATITVNQYYKVMLEALGYKQNTAEVVGDFTWTEVMEFAASKGLVKLAENTKFTNNDLAVATVEGLKTNVKETSTTLVASMVEAGMINKDAAIAAGLYEDVTTTDAKITEVKAIANDKVEVIFDSAVAKAFAEKAANYNVVVKGSTTALEVKSAVAESDSIVVIETAAQNAGTAYTLTVGEVSINFTGIAKVSGAPEIDTAKSIDTDTVEIVFTKAMDKATAENVANYTFDKGVTVKSAELWTSQDDTRKTVKLTTEGMKTNNIYKLTIQDVKSSDMVAIRTVTKSMAGTADTKAPTVSGNVIVKNNQRIILNFSDAHGIDKATAENIENYSIDNGLVITGIVAKDEVDDDYGYYDQVEISTEPMEVNKRYTLTIENLADGSVSKNVISKAITKQFGGMSADTTAPKTGAIKVYGDSMVEIAFTDTNRMDAATLTDVNNYTFDNGLQVLKAEIVRPTKPDTDLGKTVVLTTSTMDTATTYKVTIENIADEFGNVITKVNNRSIPRSQGADIKPPTVTKVVWTSLTQVKVTFDERLDVNSANDPANYVLNNNLGAVLKAEVSASDDYKVVKLTTATQATNKNYTITINGVMDRLGNPVVNAKAYFTSQVDGADTAIPEIENIYAPNDREIRVTFDEAVVVTPAVAPAVNMTIDGAAFTADIVGLIDDETTVILKTSAAMNTNDEITITALNGIKDKANNVFKVDADDKPTFYGSDVAADAVEVSTKDQLNVRTLQFTFTGPIKLANGSMTGTITANGTTFDAYVDEDADLSTTPTTNEELSTLTLVKQGSGVLPYDTTYKFDFSTALKDYLGNAVADEDVDYAGFTAYTTLLEDKDDPAIDYVESINTKTINVVYNEEIAASAPGSYEIRKSDGTASGATISAAVDSDDKNIVKLTLGGTSLKAGDVYTIKPKTGAKDIAGNTATVKDISFDFVASAVVTTDYIKGVAIIDGRTVEVRTTKSVSSDDITIKNSKGDVIQVTPGTAVSGTAVRLSLNEALLDDKTYTVEVNGLSGNYSFTGIVVDGGIDVTSNLVTFSGWNTTDFVVTVVYGGNTYYTAVVGDDISTATLYPTAVDAADGTNGTAFATVVGDNNYMVEVYRANGTAPIYGLEITQ
ncbi:MAG: hypothetical protein APF77_10090 [Clostridia bacterium BRH_c25]|nr:MAG: hypothetical protein APF77_10090 [Clostridia bacterium BRH_c25]